MSAAEQAEVALQEQIDKALERLRTLHTQIQTLREEQAPLQDEMEQVWEELQGLLADLRRRRRELGNEIGRLERSRQLEQRPRGGDTIQIGSGIVAGGGENTREVDQGKGLKGLLVPNGRRSQQQAEAIHKDELCELVAYVIENRNDPLLSRLGGLYRDPEVKLADMLELVPFGLWAKESRRERGDLGRRLERLVAWEEALSSRLASLQWLDEKLKNDRRYEPVQERRKGREAWDVYVEGEREKLRQAIADREATIEELRSQIS